MTWVLKDHIPAFAQQWQTVQEPHSELGPAMWVVMRSLQPWSVRESDKGYGQGAVMTTNEADIQ